MKDSNFSHRHTSFLYATLKSQCMNLKQQTVASALVIRNIAQIEGYK